MMLHARTDVSVYDAKKATDEHRHVSAQEIEFRIESRRNKLLAEWVADHVGLSADMVPDYLMDIISADLTKAGPDPVIAKVLADLAAAGLTDIDEAQLRWKLGELEDVARFQIQHGV